MAWGDEYIVQGEPVQSWVYDDTIPNTVPYKPPKPPKKKALTEAEFLEKKWDNDEGRQAINYWMRIHEQRQELNEFYEQILRCKITARERKKILSKHVDEVREVCASFDQYDPGEIELERNPGEYYE